MYTKQKYSILFKILLVTIFIYKNKIIECFAKHRMYYSTRSHLVSMSIVAVNRANAYFDSLTLRGRCYLSHHVLVSMFIIPVNHGDVHFDSHTTCLRVLRRDRPSHHVLVSVFIIPVNCGDVHIDSHTTCLHVLLHDRPRRCPLLIRVTIRGNYFLKMHGSS
jgi:hypothetical protein